MKQPSSVNFNNKKAFYFIAYNASFILTKFLLFHIGLEIAIFLCCSKQSSSFIMEISKYQTHTKMCGSIIGMYVQIFFCYAFFYCSLLFSSLFLWFVIFFNLFFSLYLLRLKQLGMKFTVWVFKHVSAIFLGVCFLS